VDASLITGSKSEVQIDASIQIKVRGIVPIILSVGVAQNGEVQADASTAAKFAGQIVVDGSINAFQNSEISVVASVVVEGRIAGQITVVSSVVVARGSQVQVSAQVGVIFLGVVTKPASIVAKQNAQIVITVSVNVLQGGGGVQIDASITATQNEEVFVDASVQADVLVIVDGQVLVAASMQADYRIGLDDRSGVLEKAYIPNSGRFVTRNGTLFIVDNETLRQRQEATQGFGWGLDLITNPPGELIVDTDKPGSVPLQYKIDRDGGQFGMGVLRIEIPDDWEKVV
ncbi:hypothetical protein LCGC14_1335550, partial [marine sediment metagenome]